MKLFWWYAASLVVVWTGLTLLDPHSLGEYVGTLLLGGGSAMVFFSIDQYLAKRRRELEAFIPPDDQI